MNTDWKSVFGTGFMLAMLLAAFATSAQDAADDDELMPAVDTSAVADEESPLRIVNSIFAERLLNPLLYNSHTGESRYPENTNRHSGLDPESIAINNSFDPDINLG